MFSIQNPLSQCICCGYSPLKQVDVLWQELINDWSLDTSEINYINRQQGFHCTKCGCNLRTMALATAIMNTWGYKGLFREFVHTVRARQLRVLEINTAGALTQFLSLLPKHKLRIYPDIDMMNIKINTGTFDLVVHSDTLEHISDPVQGLRECWRILKPRGHCVFTVPIIYRRLTLNRAKKAPSYHGNPEEMKNDQVVFTEYGADAWVHVIQAGFPECRIVSLEFPAAQALVAIKY